MRKYKASEKKVDLYDAENGMLLVNIRTMNEDGELDRVDTYLGPEGKQFMHVMESENLAEPGVMFSYSGYVKMMHHYLPALKEAYEDNLRAVNNLSNIATDMGGYWLLK